MFWAFAFGGFEVLLSGWILYRSLRPFRRIWAGEARLAERLPHRYQQVKARNYLAYLLCVVPGGSALGFLGVAIMLHALFPSQEVWLYLGVPAVPLLFLAMLALPAYGFVSATNRPRFLVPPPYRDQVGALAEFRRGWVRRRAARRSRSRRAFPR